MTYIGVMASVIATAMISFESCSDIFLNYINTLCGLIDNPMSLAQYFLENGVIPRQEIARLEQETSTTTFRLLMVVRTAIYTDHSPPSVFLRTIEVLRNYTERTRAIADKMEREMEAYIARSIGMGKGCDYNHIMQIFCVAYSLLIIIINNEFAS